MNEVKHFTKAPEIKHFAEVSVGTNDNVYGVTYAEAVKQYLQSAYSGEDANAEVEAFGKIYKVLRRADVTVFYDKDGNMLFDVTNERLADDYGFLSGGLADEEVAETIKQMKEHEENLSEEDNEYVLTEDSESSEEETLAEENGEAEEEVAQDTTEANGEVLTEVDGAVEENTQRSFVYIGVIGATTKLQEELKKAKEKEFAEPVIEYLVERCKESESLAADICQDHKTWEKCYQYIYESARKKLSGKSGYINDNIIFEWAEDYYRKDDKAEEEKKAKVEAEKKKQETEKKKEKKSAKSEPVKPAPEKVQTKKSGKDIDGQMDLFSLMGM